MKKGKMNKWIPVGLLWFAVILLTGYNMVKINQLHAALDQKETLRLDQQFWQRHSEDLDKLVSEGKRLYLTMDSVDMGFLFVEHRLKAISAQLDLPPITLTRQPANESDGEISLGILFAGDFNSIYKLLQSIKKEMPFIRAKNIKIDVDTVMRKIVLEASYILRYKSEPAGDEPQPPEGT